MNNETLVETEYWHELANGRLQCDLCPRYCTLADGQRGLCFVRARHGDSIVLTTYGRSSGFCIDPIEKKPLNHFYPGSAVLSFGTAGCNLACKFCQNWDISKSRERDVLGSAATPAVIAKTAAANDCRSVAFTYNDPIIFHEYAIDVAHACRDIGVHSVAVTAGYVTRKPRIAFFNAMDAANVDLKAFTDKFYRNVVGGRLSVVLDTLIYLHSETELWFEITYLMIPGYNDSRREIEALCRWLVDNLEVQVPIHFTAFHPDWKMRSVAPTPPDTLRDARRVALAHGLAYVYTGNIHDRQGDTTFCRHCAAMVIERDWYEIKRYALNADGCCKQCGQRCEGRFEPRPGTWGRQRLPITLSA